ncbi:MAG: acetyl-CoA C-acyltransferase [Actinobacteria bacterium]|nr:acetyl-CoA C-acyltransferase [Actinomycetota bacterium]
MPDSDIVILSAVRTAQGRFQGGFSGTTAQDLGALVVGEALSRAGMAPEVPDELLFGNCLQAGLGQNVARQIAISAGLPDSTPAATINRVCVSSASAMAMGAQAIKAGDAEVIVAGGVENMTRAPWLLQQGRSGYRMGLPSDKIFDAMVLDGLWCSFGDYHMGVTAENLCERFGISREAQDEVAYESHRRATAAIESGRFTDEIVPVSIPQRKGDPKIVDTDECVRRDASLEAMAKLRPFFKEGGSVTAGNSSAIADGASAVVITSRSKAAELDATPLATLVSYATAACAPEIMGYGETLAAQAALAKAGLTPADVELAELNEAFACVAALAIRELGLDAGIVNVNGGAVALGHPLGNTGTRMLVTLLHEMKKRGAVIGLTAACVGGGQGAGCVVRMEA